MAGGATPADFARRAAGGGPLLTDFASARVQLKNYLRLTGYKAKPGEEGTIKDLSTERRINVKLRTDFEMTQGYGQYTAGQTPATRALIPCQELIRVSRRRVASQLGGAVARGRRQVLRQRPDDRGERRSDLEENFALRPPVRAVRLQQRHGPARRAPGRGRGAGRDPRGLPGHPGAAPASLPTCRRAPRATTARSFTRSKPPATKSATACSPPTPPVNPVIPLAAGPTAPCRNSITLHAASVPCAARSVGGTTFRRRCFIPKLGPHRFSLGLAGRSL